jgi:hypothetical protein
VELRALATSLILAGCAHAPPAPAGNLPAAGLQRFYRVADGVYRSEQPNAAQFAELQRTYLIRTVIKLNTALPGDGGHDDLPPGVDLVHDPILPAGPISHEDLLDALRDIEDARKPHRLDRGAVPRGTRFDRTGGVGRDARVRFSRRPHRPDLGIRTRDGVRTVIGDLAKILVVLAGAAVGALLFPLVYFAVLVIS